MKRVFICLAATLLLATSAVACSSADTGSSTTAVSVAQEDFGVMKDDISPEAAAAAKAAGGSFNGETAENGGESTDTSLPADNRKIVKNSDVYMETTEFDAVSDAVKKQVSDAGGYISASSFSNNNSRGRSAMVTCRIPAESYDGFMNAVGGIGNVTDVNENTEDVTGEYIDIEARLKSLKAQEARLLELMESASDLENLIAVQNQLTETQYQIDSYTAKMDTMKDRISYSTVGINISEVVVYTPQETNFGDRIASAFKGMLHNISEGSQGFMIWFIYNLPAAIILALLLSAVIVIIRKRHKKDKAVKPAEVRKEDKEGPVK